MNNFEFISPTKIYFGEKQEEKIGNILKERGFKKVLFHYGQSSIFKSGLYDVVKKSLIENNIEFFELGNVEPNPKVELVRKGVEIAKKENIDLVLAVGGGSVIDSAKAIACGFYLEDDPWLLNTHEIVPNKALPVGVILTISAAGSELSNSCVISNSETLVKNGFNSDIIRPNFAIMNPRLTFTVSKYQTACGIVDIMMHTLERYFTDIEGLQVTNDIALGLIKSVMTAGEIAINEPENYEARATLMLASSFSHNGLTGLGNKMYFTVHKMEHTISGLYDHIAHAAGLSVLFPAWALYSYQNIRSKWYNFAKTIYHIDEQNDDVIVDVINKIKNFFKKLGMPVSLSDLNITEDEVEKIATVMSKNDTVKIPGFIELSKGDIIKILNLAK